MRIHFLLPLLLLFLMSGLQALADELTAEQLTAPPPGYLQILTTDDGSQTIGRIAYCDNETVSFLTRFGELAVPVSSITELLTVPETDLVNGQYWFPNPNRTRLYFAPTGRMLDKGEAYFADYYALFPTIAYGLTDRVTIGGGLSLIPGLAIHRQWFYLTPKVGITSGSKLSSAVGAMLIVLPGFEDRDEGDDPEDLLEEEDDPDEDPPDLISILYAVGTTGNPDASLTYGIGYGLVDAELADHPLIMLGGEKRFWRRGAFVSENWWMPGLDYPVVSYGVRFFGERLSVDLAFVNYLGELIFPGIPYLDFVVNF